MAKEKTEKTVRTLDVLQFKDDVKKGYVPEGFSSVEKYLEDMREEYEADLSADFENRREAIDDKKFAAGEQWDPQVLEHRAGLPCLTINQIPQFVAQLVGDWRQNRNAIKVLPGEDGDKEIADVRADLVRSIEYKSRADRVYDAAFESNVVCGDGAFRVAVEYAKDDVFDQEIFIRPIDDALSVVWDRMSIDPTGRDARRCFVEDLIPRKEFERKWPDASPSELGTRQQTVLRQTGWYDDKTVKVVEDWRMIERDRLIGMFDDGSVHVIDMTTIDDVIEAHGMPIRTRMAPCLYAQMHVTTGWKILSGPFEWKINRLPIIRMTGRVTNVNGARIRYGLVRFMKDPVRLRNFWRSVAAEQLGYAPKAQWLATEGAVEGREDKFRRAHLSRDPLLIVNDEAVIGQNIQKIDPPAPQMALLNEAQINAQDMKDVTGIHDASLGIRSNETSGKAIMARQREGDIASMTYFDNGNASVLEAGDVVNQLISQIYDATRIIRIIGQDESVKLMKINDPQNPESPNLAVGSYDVALDTGPSYTTRRQEAAEAMMQAIQVFPELMQVAGDLIVKAQDWPGADKIAERLKLATPPQFLEPEDQQEVAQRQQMAQQAGGATMVSPEQIQEVQAQMAELQKQNEELKAKHDIEWYNAETQRIRALSDNMVDGNQMEMNAIKEILAHSQKEADRQHQRDMQASQQQAQAAQSQQAAAAQPSKGMTNG